MLSLADDLDALWREQQENGAVATAHPPYWCLAWTGGQALARYALDHAALFRGRAVLDVGSGSGIAAIAAAMAGAARVEASDVDPIAREMIGRNARSNGVTIAMVGGDLIGTPSRWDLVVAGDLWYERVLAQRVSAWLAALAREGTLVLLGDCRRAHFPRHGVTELQRYRVASPAGTERAATTETAVWRMH